MQPDRKFAVALGGYLVIAIITLAAILLLVRDREMSRCPDPRSAPEGIGR